MTDSAVIELSDLTKYYGDVRGVEGLSFAVPEGEIFGFLGPNGAGKTTTIRLLLGLLKPTAGTATVFGSPVTDRAALVEAKRRLGYIPGDAEFYERTTGERLLDYFERLRGGERREELLERFPVPAERPIRTYSRGNRQKLAIVQAFMHDPDLVVMDEPTSGLDPLVQNEFYELIETERHRGVSIFFSSHILSEVRRMCDRVAVIRNGRLVTLEDIDSLLAKSGKVVRADLAEAPDLNEFAFDGVARAAVDADGTLELVLTGDYDTLVDRLARYTVRDLEIRETSLEDVFLHFYDGSEADDEADGATDTDERGRETGPRGDRTGRADDRVTQRAIDGDGESSSERGD